MSKTRSGPISNQDIDTLENVAEIPCGDCSEMWISFVVGGADLTDFDVYFKAHQQGGEIPVATAAADYTSPEGPILGASSDLSVAASGATVHWIKLNVKGVEMVVLKAAGTSSTITGHWGGD
jgi:hypothetical protein